MEKMLMFPKQPYFLSSMHELLCWCSRGFAASLLARCCLLHSNSLRAATGLADSSSWKLKIRVLCFRLLLKILNFFFLLFIFFLERFLSPINLNVKCGWGRTRRVKSEKKIYCEFYLNYNEMEISNWISFFAGFCVVHCRMFSSYREFDTEQWKSEFKTRKIKQISSFHRYTWYVIIFRL